MGVGWAKIPLEIGPDRLNRTILSGKEQRITRKGWGIPRSIYPSRFKKWGSNSVRKIQLVILKS